MKRSGKTRHVLHRSVFAEINKISDHNTVQQELNCQIELEQQTPKRDFKNTNFDKMEEVLKQVNWKEELRECTADEAWKRTKEKLQHQIRTHVPMKQPYKKKKTL